MNNLDEKGYPKYKPSNGEIDRILHKHLGIPLKDDEDKGDKVFAMGAHRQYEIIVYQTGEEYGLRIRQYVDIKFPMDQYPWAHRELKEQEKEFIKNVFLKDLLKSLLREDQILVRIIDGGIQIVHTCVCAYPTTEEMIYHASAIVDFRADYWEKEDN